MYLWNLSWLQILWAWYFKENIMNLFFFLYRALLLNGSNTTLEEKKVLKFLHFFTFWSKYFFNIKVWPHMESMINDTSFEIINLRKNFKVKDFRNCVCFCLLCICRQSLPQSQLLLILSCTSQITNGLFCLVRAL